jgi:hypothetical protein
MMQRQIGEVMATFWISFSTDEKWLGAAIVDMDDEGASVKDVVKKAVALGCAPGDGRAQRVQVQRIPGDRRRLQGFKNRLLGDDDLDHFNAVAGGLGH